jgi:hypothetical protein
MMISRREAVRVLRAAAHEPPTKRLAEGLLVAGFAGPSCDTGGVSLYQRDEVCRLAETPHVDLGDLPGACRSAVLVVRISGTSAAALKPAPERRALAVGPWWISWPTRLALTIGTRRQGSVPVVVTIASYVLCTADLVGLRLVGTPNGRPDDDGPYREGGGVRTTLELDAPGSWSEAFDGRRLVTPPGNPWLLWQPCGTAPASRAA